jgi:hypothetical protein
MTARRNPARPAAAEPPGPRGFALHDASTFGNLSPYWPGGTTPPLPDRLLSVFPKRHGTATITWPPEPTGAQAGS